MFLIIVRPRLRPIAMMVPAALLAVCALYIVVEQYRFRYPPVLEWPTLFPHAGTLAWIAVILLTADALVEILRSRPARGPNAGPADAPPDKREPGPETTAS